MDLLLDRLRCDVTCSYCRDVVAGDAHVCPCGATYHVDCRAALERCATLGCLSPVALAMTLPAPDREQLEKNAEDARVYVGIVAGVAVLILVLGVVVLPARFSWIAPCVFGLAPLAQALIVRRYTLAALGGVPAVVEVPAQRKMIDRRATNARKSPSKSPGTKSSQRSIRPL